MKSFRRTRSRAALFSLSLLALSLSPAALAQQTPDAVTLTVTVTDKKGNFVGGLREGDFAVYDNKTPQEVSSFAARDEPLSVAVVVDFSPSMVIGGGQLQAAGEALMRFAELGHPANEYLLVGFAASPVVLADWTRGGAAFSDRLAGLKTVDVPGRKSALYDACYVGMEKLRGGAHPRRVLLLISDGMESGSRRTFKELREALRSSDVLFYSAGSLETPRIPGADAVVVIDDPEARAVKKKLSAISGGAAFFPTSAREMKEALEAVAIELRHQYLLGFKPQGAVADGKWHQLKVALKLRAGNLSVRTREGYYAARNLP